MPADKNNENLETGEGDGTSAATTSIPISPNDNTKEPRFMLPSTDGSPPKILTMNEVVDVVKNIQNMELVHEIALNPEFKLKPYEPPENSLEKKIKEIMHKAFWDVLREQLNNTPPSFDHAIQLLSDIKECFPQIIPANNKRILDHINEVLDLTLIRQQAEQGVLDFRLYANYIIQIMSKCCAPVRDAEIEAIKQLDDIVDIFKGILETMSVMKLDMANCLLEFARNDLLANSVEYEKKKFNEYLEYYKLGFPITENWLKTSQVAKADGQKSSVYETVLNASMNLLKITDEKEFPEILSMDKDRIMKLNIQAIKLCVCASVTSICSAVPILSQKPDSRQSLAHEITILLQNCVNKLEIEALAENIWLQALTSINKLMKETNEPLGELENALKNQIIPAVKMESPVYSLLLKRLETYLKLSIKVKGNIPVVPPGFLELKTELESFAAAYKRIISYNFSVFGDYYTKVLNDSVLKYEENIAAPSSNTV